MVHGEVSLIWKAKLFQVGKSTCLITGPPLVSTRIRKRLPVCELVITVRGARPTAALKRGNLCALDRRAKNSFAVPERSESESHQHCSATDSSRSRRRRLRLTHMKTFQFDPHSRQGQYVYPGRIITLTHYHALGLSALCPHAICLCRQPCENYNTFGSAFPPSTALQLPGRRTA
ncbi:hypothetical protein H4582DRAFT_105498 [Lactarius indigo]|nr:hypothetical protein H4582DRAFT_105498 [Lactarius indigo]